MNVPLTASPHNAQDQQPGANNALVALLDHAVVAPLATPGWLRVTGEDRVRWLNGMLTNSIQTLTPGDGTYNFALSAQGRIQADATVFALADELRIETNRPAELLAHLDRFIIMDDVELTLLPSHHGILVAGPNAAALLTGLLNITLPAAPLALVQTTWQDEPIDLIHAYSPLVPRYELWSTPSAISTLSAALVDAGAVPAGAETVEDLRMLEGTPLYGVDIRDKELPQETAQARALHFSKGCYLGQEIVERIHSRGNVHRTFAAFALTGDLPAPGTALSAADTPQSENARPLGELTSTRLIHLPGGPLQLALGYIRRDALDRAQPLIFPGGQAVPVTLPLAAALSKSVQAE